MSVLTAVLAVPSGYPKWLSVEYLSPLVREDMALVLADAFVGAKNTPQ